MNMRVSVLRVCALSIPVSILFGQVVYNSVPSRIVGQAVLQQSSQPTATAINLVEGRELNSPQAVAVDTPKTTASWPGRTPRDSRMVHSPTW